MEEESKNGGKEVPIGDAGVTGGYKTQGGKRVREG